MYNLPQVVACLSGPMLRPDVLHFYFNPETNSRWRAVDSAFSSYCDYLFEWKYVMNSLYPEYSNKKLNYDVAECLDCYIGSIQAARLEFSPIDARLIVFYDGDELLKDFEFSWENCCRAGVSRISLGVSHRLVKKDTTIKEVSHE